MIETEKNSVALSQANKHYVSKRDFERSALDRSVSISSIEEKQDARSHHKKVPSIHVKSNKHLIDFLFE